MSFDNQLENLLSREEKEILIDYEQLLFPSSICCSTKQTQKVMRQIGLKKRKYTRSTVSISALWIFLQTQISGLRTIYVSGKEVR